jgi:4-amino-4-deoxy-L-arabinose transferase-like glycosyltransferase
MNPAKGDAVPIEDEAIGFAENHRPGHLVACGLLTLVFLLGISIRLFKLTNPPLDFFATRQLRSALIARSVFYRLNQDADPSKSANAIALAKLEVYEPPILENLVGFADYVVGSENAWMGRVFNAFFWAVGGLALYLIGKRFTSYWAVLIGLCFYFFLPYSVTASRSFQPEPWMAMWILLSAWALLRWSEQKTWKRAIIAGVLCGIAVLIKVVAAFFIAGMLACLALAVFGLRRVWRSLHVWAMGGLALVPTLAYYLIFQTERSTSFMGFWTVALSHLILTSNFYADWLAMVKGLMGLTTFMAAILGVFLAKREVRPVLIGLWAGYGIYGLTFPYQYTTHEYYHLTLVPIVALSVLPVLDAFFKVLRNQPRVWKAGATAVFLFACFYSLYVARSQIVAADYSNEPKSWQRVGEALPAGKPFVALTADYGMRLSYYGWRSQTAAWPSTADLKLYSLAGDEALSYDTYFAEITAGKDYFLVTAYSELEAQPQLKALLEKYSVFEQGNGFTIYDLTQPLDSKGSN